MSVRFMAVVFAASLTFCAIAFAARTLADPTPAAAPTPAPAPTSTPAVFLEAGNSNDELSNNRGTWDDSNLQAIVTGKISAYALAASEERFGFNDHWYEAGVYVPTGEPHGTLSFTAGFSPEHNVLPETCYNLAYDRRAGGGYGYQIGYTGKTYPGINVSVDNVGFDHYYGDRRLAFSINLATLSNVPGTALSYTGKWSLYAPRDTLSISAVSGRDVENNGPAIAVYQVTGLDVDELHWLTQDFAVHAGAGFCNLAGAYGRFEVRLGVRGRL